jgi:hypothetical protein
MKKYLMFLFGLLLFVVCTSCKEKIDVAKEEAAIKAVIEEENNAFIAMDFNRFSATYVQDETNIRLTADKSTYNYWIGWKEIGSAFKKYFDSAPTRSDSKYVKTDYKIKVYSESAWETHKELVYDNKGEVIAKLITVRILEKVNGKWKIAFLSVVNTSSYDEKPVQEKEVPKTK